MADKHRSLVSVFLEFVAGERPTADKFNALVSQTKRGFFNLETAVGDVHDESWPYTGNATSINPTRLTIPWGTQYGSENKVIGTSVDGRPLNIANLARLIGPASNLNPRAVNEFPTIAKGHEIVGEIVTAEVREYDFRYPIELAAIGDALLTPVFSPNGVGTAFENAQSTLGAVVTAGDYFIDIVNSKVYTWLPIGTGAATSTTVNYTVRAVEFGGGPNYALARFNTIPDPNQIIGGTGLSWLNGGAPDAQGVYGLTFPVIEKQQSNYDQTNATLAERSDLNYGELYKLPYYFENSQLAINDVIPQGLLYLRCEDTGQNFTEATYFYTNQTSIRVGNIDLPTGHAGLVWSLVTVGTDITTSIDDLRQKSFTHSHNRKYGEPAISVRELTDNFARIAHSGRFYPNEETYHPTNFFPQYLHRDGYRSAMHATDALQSDFSVPFAVSGLSTTDHVANDQNAIRGHLVIGRRTDGNTPNVELTQDNHTDLGGYLGSMGESFMLSFGDKPHNVGNTPSTLNPNAPQIWRNVMGPSGHFRIESQKDASIALFTGNEIAIDATSFVDSASSLRRVTINADKYALVRSRDSVQIMQWNAAAHTVDYPVTPTNPELNAGIRIQGLSGNVLIEAKSDAVPHYNHQLNPHMTRAAASDNRGVVAIAGDNATVALKGMQLGTDLPDNNMVGGPLYSARDNANPGVTDAMRQYTFTTNFASTNPTYADLHSDTSPAFHDTYYNPPGTTEHGDDDCAVNPEVKMLWTSHATLATGMHEWGNFASEQQGAEANHHTGSATDNQHHIHYFSAVLPVPCKIQNDSNTICLGYNLMVRRNRSSDFNTWAHFGGIGPDYDQKYPASGWMQGSMHCDRNAESDFDINTDNKGFTELGIWSELTTDLTPDDMIVWGDAEPYNWNQNALRVLLFAGGVGPQWDPVDNAGNAFPLGQNLAHDSEGNFSWHNANPFHYNWSFKMATHPGNVPDSGLGERIDQYGAYWWLPIGIRVLWFYTTR